MERSSTTDQAQLMLNEMIFISSHCAQTCIDPDRCSKSDMAEISSVVSRVFIALVFAKLKQLREQSLYDALTAEFQRMSPSLFGNPAGRFIFNLFHRGQKASDLPLATVRQFEEMLYDRERGDVHVALVRAEFRKINEAKTSGAVALWVGGPCKVKETEEALLDHYDKICQWIETMIEESSCN